MMFSSPTSQLTSLITIPCTLAARAPLRGILPLTVTAIVILRLLALSEGLRPGRLCLGLCLGLFENLKVEHKALLRAMAQVAATLRSASRGCATLLAQRLDFQHE